MEIKITINGLDQLTEALALIGSALALQRGMVNTAEAAANLMLDVTDKIEDLTGGEDDIEETTKESAMELTANEEKKDVSFKITIEDVRAAFMAKNSKGNTEKLKSILNDFGVKKVTDLEEKDFEAVLNALEEI